MKNLIKKFPATRLVSGYLWKLRNARKASVSRAFWENRYSEGGTSGPGSYGQLADFKSRTINDVISRYSVKSIIDFGCGDGNQIRDLTRIDYLGIDVSEDAVKRCRSAFAGDPNKNFVIAEKYNGETADAAMSLDVLFHLVEDSVYENYMTTLFNCANRIVLIYASNFEELCLNPLATPTHVRHRKFQDWVAKNFPQWKLEEQIRNPYKLTADTTPQTHSRSDFYIFSRKGP